MNPAEAAILCLTKIAFMTTQGDIPAGGDVVLQCPEANCDNSLPSLDFIDAATQLPIAGTVIQKGSNPWGNGWAVFRPAQPLEVGQRVMVNGALVLAVFQVVEASAFDPTQVLASAGLEYDSTPSADMACCENANSGCGSFETCVSRNETTSAGLRIALLNPTAAATQYLYEVTFQAEGAEPVTSDPFPWFDSTFHSFSTFGGEYCYTLTARSLADGTRVDLAQDCLAASVPLGEHETDDAKLQSSLRTCNDPPTGWEEDWCEAWRPSCEQGAALCPSSRADTCDWDLPVDRDAGMEGDLVIVHKGDGSLCSVSTRASGTPRWSLLWLVCLSACGLSRGHRRRVPVRR
ncbi:MAG: hypothetical protein QM778_19885 [Myxococcales bacterium]